LIVKNLTKHEKSSKTATFQRKKGNIAMTKYQIKAARLILHMTQEQLATALGLEKRAVYNYERNQGACPLVSQLAIRYLLIDAGIYSHFRMIYMRKDKRMKIPQGDRVGCRTKRDIFIDDALKFKCDK
jgi:DNA-binding XRE family transcriptional regulator